MTKRYLLGSFAASALALAAFGPSHGNAAGEATVIDLTQTACQFVEVEGVDHGFASTAKADCETINAESGADRLAKSETLTLKPGKHIFRVTNENVPYELGFWLRGSGLVNRATLPSVSGGGLTEGATKDYEIELTAGEYVFSCPLNPTLDYKLVVEG
ncbi:MAG: hypothetical protein AAGC99_10825 [Pseudomonadota bacterium]